MQLKRSMATVIFTLAGLSALAGCTPAPPPTPTPDPNATPAMRSDNPAVLNDPNVPESIKQQIRGATKKQ